MYEVVDIEEEARECGFELFSKEPGKSVFTRRTMGFGEDGNDRVEFAMYVTGFVNPCWQGYAEHIDRNGDTWFKSGVVHGINCSTVGKKLVGNRGCDPLCRGDQVPLPSKPAEQKEEPPRWTHTDEQALQLMIEGKKKFEEYEARRFANFFVDVADEPLDNVIAFMKKNADTVCELLEPYRQVKI